MAAGLGKRVLVLEKEASPQDAALRGGLPSKTLVRAAATAEMIRTASKFGLKYSPGEIDTGAVLPKVRAVIGGMTGLNRNGRMHQLGIAYLLGAAEFIDSHHIRVDSATYSAGKFVIATGARPVLPKNLGKDGASCLTNETFFKLDRLPKSMIVIGGGPTGIEMALALTLLGVEVTVVEAAATILGSEDREAAGHVAEYLSARGMIMFTGHKATGLKQIGDQFELTIADESGEQLITADRVLFTVGREANVQGPALEKAGVEYDSRAIKVDKHLRTTSPHILACGDVTGCIHLVGVVEHEGLVAVNSALLPFKQSVVHKDTMWNIFTEPPLAHVGLTEEEVKAEYGFTYRFTVKTMKISGGRNWSRRASASPRLSAT
jgi:pyruvate/2-oxoglutarate dehydrogenase complex dihydrolipoamide dehydrogenase (E3) component